jgi:hypothetical protein
MNNHYHYLKDDEGNNLRVYDGSHDDGINGFIVSVNECAFPGIYDSVEACKVAVTRTDEWIDLVWKSKVKKFGPNAVITLEDLRMV